MPNNDNFLDDGILDPMDLDSPPSDTGYVPKFERDLANAGSLQALSQAKKAESDDVDSISISNIDLSSLRSESEYAQYEADNEPDDDNFIYPEEEKQEDDDDGLLTLGTYSSDNEENPHYQLHTKSGSQNEEERPAPRSFADFAKEAEEAERARAEAEQAKEAEHNLDSIKASSVILSDMDYDADKNKSKALHKQMQMDDLAMSMGKRPLVKEMSDEYAPEKKKNEDLAAKDVLDEDEKRILRERLEREVGRRSEDAGKKKSLELYHNLMNEQKVKKAKKGFFMVLLLAALGIICAVISYFKLNWGEQAQAFDESGKIGQYLIYLPLATGFFALLMLIKLKPCKVLSSIYFAANTVILIGPGFIKFALDTNQAPEFYIQTLIFYVLAILISAYVCITLCTNENVEAYYTTQLLSDKKKVIDDRKSKYRQ